MKIEKQFYSGRHLHNSVDFSRLEEGTVLIKIKLVSDYKYDSTTKECPKIELHGFIDEKNNIYITNEIVSEPEVES